MANDGDDDDQKKFDWDLPPGRKPEKPAKLHARKTDPSTSHKAMENMDLVRVKSASTVCHEIHQEAKGGLADWQYLPIFRERWGGNCDTSLYRQARNQCVKQGLIEATGELRVNPASGQEQKVWRACNKLPPKPPERCESCGQILPEAVTRKAGEQ